MGKLKRPIVEGDQYGRLTIIKRTENGKGGKIRVLCYCNCPKQTIREYDFIKLVNGHTKSCGCIRSEMASSKKQGFKEHPLYQVWQNIKGRCLNPNRFAYEYYGGRGITICDEWKNSAGKFICYCIDNGWKEGLTIDRIDNDKNYEPENIRFITQAENNFNQRPMQKNNSTGYRGVYFRKGDEKRKEGFYFSINYKHKHLASLGGFESAIDAALARNKFITDNNLPHTKCIV